MNTEASANAVEVLGVQQVVSGALTNDSRASEVSKVVAQGLPYKGNQEERWKPWYIWKARSTYYPSKVEMCIVEEFLQSKSYPRCVKAVKERCGKKISYPGVKACLERDHVKDFVFQRLDELGVYAGWDEAHWMWVMQRHLDGTERLKNGDLYGMGLIAKHKGWGAGQGTQVVTQINFTER